MFRKPTFNSLYDPFGSPYRGQKPSLPLKKEFFLPLRLSCKESSTSNQAFLLRRKDVTALLGTVYAPPVPPLREGPYPIPKP